MRFIEIKRDQPVSLAKDLNVVVILISESVNSEMRIISNNFCKRE